MSVKIIGGVSGVNADVDTTFQAARVTLRPAESLGAYRLSAYSGLITGIAAGGPLIAFRWTDATRFCILRMIEVQWQTVAGFTAAQEIGMDAIVARAWTVADSGGTDVTPAAASNTNKRRTTMPTSLMAATAGSIRMPLTAVLTAGTRTLDGNPFLAGSAAELAAAATVAKQRMSIRIDNRDQASYPFVFANQEGFVIRNGLVAMGAGGTARLSLEMEWAEVTAF